MMWSMEPNVTDHRGRPWQRSRTSAGALGLFVAIAVGSAAAGRPSTEDSGWTLDSDSSLVAVVTHKEGLAAGLAHEHLIAAPLADLATRLDVSEPEAAEVHFAFDVTTLVVDDPDLQQLWQQELLDAGVLTAPFADLKPKDRRKIRQSMLGRKQLDSEAFPEIRALVDAVRMEGAEAVARLTLTVKDRPVVREVRIPWPAVADGELLISFDAEFSFSEFGIEPYSALLGAIRVADEFDVVVRLVAAAAP